MLRNALTVKCLSKVKKSDANAKPITSSFHGQFRCEHRIAHPNQVLSGGRIR
jgi:hypothetical protein